MGLVVVRVAVSSPWVVAIPLCDYLGSSASRGRSRRAATGHAGTYVCTRVEKKWTVTFTPTGGMSTPSLSRVDEPGGFSAGHSGLSLPNRGEHAFTEIQAFVLPHAAAEGKPELARLNGELA